MRPVIWVLLTHKIDTRFVSKRCKKDAGAEGPICVLEELGRKARV